MVENNNVSLWSRFQQWIKRAVTPTKTTPPPGEWWAIITNPWGHQEILDDASRREDILRQAHNWFVDHDDALHDWADYIADVLEWDPNEYPTCRFAIPTHNREQLIRDRDKRMRELGWEFEGYTGGRAPYIPKHLGKSPTVKPPRRRSLRPYQPKHREKYTPKHRIKEHHTPSAPGGPTPIMWQAMSHEQELAMWALEVEWESDLTLLYNPGTPPSHTTHYTSQISELVKLVAAEIVGVIPLDYWTLYCPHRPRGFLAIESKRARA
jgi:hypothetical protein